MKSIVRLKLNHFKEVKIQESIDIIDHRNYYDIKFPNYYNVNSKFYDMDYYVPKNLYGSTPHKERFELNIFLYVNGTKYYDNPEYYINLIKNYKISK